MKTPKSWDDITMGNFAGYLKVRGEKLREGETDIQLLHRKYAALLGTSIEVVQKIPIEQLNIISMFIRKLPSRLVLSFKVNDKRYRPVIDARKLNGEKYAAVKLAQSRDPYETLPQVLFIISEQRKFGLRKSWPFIGYKTIEPKPEDIEQSIEDFKQLPVSVGWPMASFFLNVSKQLRDRLKDYSLDQLDRMTQEMNSLRRDLESDTDL